MTAPWTGTQPGTAADRGRPGKPGGHLTVHAAIRGQQIQLLVLGQAIAGGGEAAEGDREENVAVLKPQAVEELADQPGDVVGQRARQYRRPRRPAAGLLERKP